MTHGPCNDPHEVCRRLGEMFDQLTRDLGGVHTAALVCGLRDLADQIEAKMLRPYPPPDDAA